MGEGVEKKFEGLENIDSYNTVVRAASVV